MKKGRKEECKERKEGMKEEWKAGERRNKGSNKERKERRR